MNPERQIPPDFPHYSHPTSISGAQPKFPARKIGDKYVIGLTHDELWERYDICEDLAQQLTVYCRRKEAQEPSWSHTQTLQRTRDGVRAKGWDVSELELRWVIDRVAGLLGWDLIE